MKPIKYLGLDCHSIKQPTELRKRSTRIYAQFPVPTKKIERKIQLLQLKTLLLLQVVASNPVCLLFTSFCCKENTTTYIRQYNSELNCNNQRHQFNAPGNDLDQKRLIMEDAVCYRMGFFFQDIIHSIYSSFPIALTII